jgi:hypothetical protein
VGNQTVPPLVHALLDVVERHAAPAGREWLRRTAGRLSLAVAADDLAVPFAAASRMVGRNRFEPTPDEIARLRVAGAGTAFEAWSTDDAARVALLLLAADGVDGPALETLVLDGYEHGDTRERQAILRGLSLLPESQRFVPLAVEACRSSIQSLFEAIACENPYPAARFPELNFNQMVLKALFTGVSLERVVGLRGRITSELVRMANDYASERRAAGRSVPADIAWLTATSGRTQ